MVRAVCGDNINYILRHEYVPEIHLVIEFDRLPDVDRLRRALRLLLDAEPVLGSAYLPRFIRPLWRPVDDLDKIDLLQTSGNFGDFLAAPLDPLNGPQLRALLYGDQLVLKVNHQVADAGGVKEVGYLLAQIYSMLTKYVDYMPPLNRGSRSMAQVYGRFGPFRLLRILLNHFAETKRSLVPLKSLTYPCGDEASGGPSFVVRRIEGASYAALREYGRRYNCTINDMVVAALLRAYVEQAGLNGVLRMVGTVDLRRYLPNEEAAAICNLSSFCYLNLGQELGENFDQTVMRVKACIDHQKAGGLLGLSFFLGTWLTWLPWPFGVKERLIPRFFRTLFEKGNVPPSMTNMGPIRSLDFGELKVKHAELIVPAGYPPMVVPGLSGYGDSLTLSMGFFESAIPRAKVEELFTIVERELP